MTALSSAVPGSILSGLISTVVGHSARHPLAVGEGVETTAQLLAWAEAMPMCEVVSSLNRGKSGMLILEHQASSWSTAQVGVHHSCMEESQ